jgi:hypothetical protein
VFVNATWLMEPGCHSLPSMLGICLLDSEQICSSATDRSSYVCAPCMQANDAATLAAQLQGISLGLVPPRVVAPRVSGAAVSSQDNNEGLVPSVAAQAAGASVPGGPGSAPAALSSGPRPRAAPGPSSLSTSTAPADGPGSAESARNNDAGVSAAGDAGEAPTAAQAQADAPALAE